MTYAETLEYLFTAMPSFQNIGDGAYKPGLERISEFCARLGNPHLKYEVIHIAGTNGKGSTSHMLASVMQQSGRRTALFTSPHLRDFRERIRINGVMISEDEVVEFVAQYREDMERCGLSFFEMTAAMAFDHFARHGAEVAIIETGLGGRLDATNIVSPRLCIITNIGLDHTRYLGNTLAEIAREKGGIIKPSTPIILGEQGEEYTSVIEGIAHSRGAEFVLAQEVAEVTEQNICDNGQRITLRDRQSNQNIELTLDLAGVYQSRNIVTLYCAAKQLNITHEAIVSGLSRVIENTSLVGRWQTLSLSPHVVCDTGHNAHGIRYIAEQLHTTPHRRLIMVLGFANDKNVAEILPLFPKEAHYIFTQPKVDRALPCREILPVASAIGYKCEAVEDVRTALTHAKELAHQDDLIFVGGSNFVVAEVM